MIYDARYLDKYFKYLLAATMHNAEQREGMIGVVITDNSGHLWIIRELSEFECKVSPINDKGLTFTVRTDPLTGEIFLYLDQRKFVGTKQCAECGRAFSYEHNRMKYCSEQCKMIATNRKSRERRRKHDQGIPVPGGLRQEGVSPQCDCASN